MIAITFALRAESSDLLAHLRDKHRVRSADTRIVYGKIGHREIAICHTGVGKESCEQKLGNLFHSQPLEFLISAGFAGAVRDDLRVGDLLLAENFSSRELLLLAQSIPATGKVHVGSLFTSPTIVDSIEERNKIARLAGAAAVDMETEFIARACEKHGVPMLSLRVISDTPGEPLPAPPAVLFDLKRQRPDVLKLSSHLVRHPGSVPRLIQFARQIARARESLTSALVTLLPHDDV